jgi:hypothetical protein
MKDHPIVEAKIWNRTTKEFDLKSGRFHGFGTDFETEGNDGGSHGHDADDMGGIAALGNARNLLNR